MAEMQEFSPGNSLRVAPSWSQRKYLALASLAAVVLFVSFWSGVQFQKNHAASTNPSVNTASQHGYYYGENDSSNDYQTQDNSSLDVQTN